MRSKSPAIRLKSTISSNEARKLLEGLDMMQVERRLEFYKVHLVHFSSRLLLPLFF